MLDGMLLVLISEIVCARGCVGGRVSESIGMRGCVRSSEHPSLHLDGGVRRGTTCHYNH